MSERKKYTIIATQTTLYRKEFYAHSHIKALKLAEESYPEEWEVIKEKDWEYKITEESK